MMYVVIRSCLTVVPSLAVPRPVVPAGFARVLVPRMAETGVVTPPEGALKLVRVAVVKPALSTASSAEYGRAVPSISAGFLVS